MGEPGFDGGEGRSMAEPGEGEGGLSPHGGVFVVEEREKSGGRAFSPVSQECRARGPHFGTSVTQGAGTEVREPRVRYEDQRLGPHGQLVCAVLLTGLKEVVEVASLERK
nr:hypothetical protein [Myxococcus eversor]